MAEMSKKEMPRTKGVVWKTLKYFFPIAWKFDKMYFILSVVNVIVGAALPFVDILLLPLLVALSALIALPIEKLIFLLYFKDAGKKLCAINAIADTSMIHPVMDKLLLAPDKRI